MKESATYLTINTIDEIHVSQLLTLVMSRYKLTRDGSSVK